MIKKRSIYFLIILFSLVVFSCKNEKKAKIYGSFENSKFSKIYIDKLQDDKKTNIDSAVIINHKFKISLNIHETGFYFLRLEDNNVLPLIVSPENEIYLKLNSKNIAKPLEIKGSDELKKYILLNNNLNNCYTISDSLSKIFDNQKYSHNFDSIKSIVDSNFNSMFANHRKYLINYITSNQNSLTTILAFYQTLGKKSFFDELADFQILLKLYNNLKISYKENSFFKFFENKVLIINEQYTENQNIINSLAKGKTAPEIESFDINDKEFVLSKITKPKILFFWSLNNIKSKKEILQLKNKSKKHIIIAISLDNNAKLWRKIAERELSFCININEGFGFESEIAKKYNIKSLPYYFIIDSKGTILEHSNNL